MCSKGRSCLRGFVSLHQGVPLPKTETRIKHKNTPKVQRYLAHHLFYLVVLVHIINPARCALHQGIAITTRFRYSFFRSRARQAASIRILPHGISCLSTSISLRHGKARKAITPCFTLLLSPSSLLLPSFVPPFCSVIICIPRVRIHIPTLSQTQHLTTRT